MFSLMTALLLVFQPVGARANLFDDLQKAKDGIKNSADAIQAAASAIAESASGLPMSEKSCTEIDLRKTCMKHVKTLSQDDMGVCHTFSAAALVDAWRFSHGDTNYDHQTSPIEAAINRSSDSAAVTAATQKRHADQVTELTDDKKADLSKKGEITKWADYYDKHEKTQKLWDSFEVGFYQTSDDVCDIVDHIQKAGSCDHRALKDKINYLENAVATEDRGSAVRPEEFFQRLASYFDVYHDYLKMVSTASETDRQRALDEAAIGVCQAIATVGVGVEPSFEAIEKALQLDNVAQFVGAVVTQGCAGEHRLLPGIVAPPKKAPRCTRSFVEKSHSRHQEINDSLAAGQPVSIGYCAGVLTSPPGYKDTGDFKSDGHRECGSDGHVSVIVGRSWNKERKSCEYIVHNSWGTGCNAYKQPCDKTKPETSKNFCGWSCDDGNVTIDGKTLGDNIMWTANLHD